MVCCPPQRCVEGHQGAVVGGQRSGRCAGMGLWARQRREPAEATPEVTPERVGEPSPTWRPRIKGHRVVGRPNEAAVHAFQVRAWRRRGGVGGRVVGARHVQVAGVARRSACIEAGAPETRVAAPAAARDSWSRRAHPAGPRGSRCGGWRPPGPARCPRRTAGWWPGRTSPGAAPPRRPRTAA